MKFNIANLKLVRTEALCNLLLPSWHFSPLPWYTPHLKEPREGTKIDLIFGSPIFLLEGRDPVLGT